MNYVNFLCNCVTDSDPKSPIFVVEIFSFLELKIMNTIEIKGAWKKRKGELKQKFAFLTDNDLMFEDGEQEEMFRKLQIRLGKTKEELHKILAAL